MNHCDPVRLLPLSTVHTCAFRRHLPKEKHTLTSVFAWAIPRLREPVLMSKYLCCSVSKTLLNSHFYSQAEWKTRSCAAASLPSGTDFKVPKAQKKKKKTTQGGAIWHRAAGSRRCDMGTSVTKNFLPPWNSVDMEPLWRAAVDTSFCRPFFPGFAQQLWVFTLKYTL